jgi:uncharacterized membrane protein HdeD (DUF308 family)
MIGYSQPPHAATTGAGWALIIIGALTAIAGIVAIIFPGVTLFTLVLLFGWFAIVAGVMEVIHAFTGSRSTEGKLLLALWGLATIVIGLIALILPGVTVASFVVLMAAYFLITGVTQIVAAFRGHLHGWLLLWGVIGVIAGLAAIFYPGAAALTLAIIFGVYAILGGLTALAAGIAVLRHRGDETRVVSRVA